MKAHLINYNDHTNIGSDMIFAIGKDKTIVVSYEDMDDDCIPHFSSDTASQEEINAFIPAYDAQFDIENPDVIIF